MQKIIETIQNHEVTIVLPFGYTDSETYPTIYLQDGGQFALHALNAIEHLIRTQQIHPFILIGIEPHNRNDDYTPWPAPALKKGAPSFGGNVRAYLAIVTETIKPYIDTHYQTKPAANQTTIGGASLGGLATIIASYEYPEIFGNYISLSSSFWFENIVHYLQGREIDSCGHLERKPIVDRTHHKFYGYVGELEGIHKDNCQKYMVDETIKAYIALRNEGFTDDRFLFETHSEGTHDTVFFTRHFIRAIKWLFKKN